LRRCRVAKGSDADVDRFYTSNSEGEIPDIYDKMVLSFILIQNRQ
jgi:hypothetical protein